MQRLFSLVSFVYSHNMVLPLFVLHLMHPNFWASLLRAVLFLLLFVLPPLFSVFLSHISHMLFDAVFFLMFFDCHYLYSCLYLRLSMHTLFPIFRYIYDPEMLDHVKRLKLLRENHVSYFLTKQYVHNLNGWLVHPIIIILVIR